MKSGHTLWDELCHKYDAGVKSASQMVTQWKSIQHAVDPERYQHVLAFLKIQEKEARWWRNACLLYFQQFSQKAFPEGIEQPSGDLETYRRMRFRYAPGIRPSW